MELEQLLISLSGLGLTILTIVVSAARHTKALHRAELDAAANRGALEQKIKEAEEDIDRIGDRMRGIEGGQQILEQSQATLAANLSGLMKTIDSIDKRVDHLIKIHTIERQK